MIDSFYDQIIHGRKIGAPVAAAAADEEEATEEEEEEEATRPLEAAETEETASFCRDMYHPWAGYDDNMQHDAAYSLDFSFFFSNDIIDNRRVLKSFPSLDSIENLSLDDF